MLCVFKYLTMFYFSHSLFPTKFFISIFHSPSDYDFFEDFFLVKLFLFFYEILTLTVRRFQYQDGMKDDNLSFVLLRFLKFLLLSPLKNSRSSSFLILLRLTSIFKSSRNLTLYDETSYTA